MTATSANADAQARPLSASGGLTGLVAWLAIVGCATFVVFLGGALPFLHIPAARIAVQAITLAFAVASVVLIWSGRIDPRTSLRIPVIACIAVVALSTVLSEQPSISREALGLLLLAAPIYPLLRAITWSDRFGTRLENLVAIAAVAVVAGYAIQAGLIWVRWWAEVGLSIPPIRPGDVALTTGTVNSLATYVELLVPPAIWIVWHRVGRPAAVVLAIAAAVAVIVTGSRGAWLGLIVAAGAMAVLYRVQIGSAVRERFAARPRLPPVLAIGAIALLLAGFALALPRLAAGDAGRIELWQAAIRIGFDHPLLGAGPGTWQDLRTFESISEPKTAALFTPHNGVLQVFAESGAAGLLAGGLLVFAIGRLAWTSIRTAPTPADQAFRALTTVSLIAVGVHSLVDPLFGVPGVAVLVLLAIARLESPAESALSRGLSRRRAIETGAAAALAVILLVPVDMAMVRAASGNGALDRSDWATARSEFDAAIGLDDRPVYRLGQALALAGEGDATGARAALDAAGRTDDLTFMTAANAVLAAAAGDPDGALTLSQEVIGRGPYDPTATINAAVIQYDAGRQDEAEANLTAAMAAVPSLTYSQRPDSLFDEATWTASTQAALAEIRERDPALYAYCVVRGAAPAPDRDAALELLPPGPEREMLQLLATAEAGGVADVSGGAEIVRSAPTSPIVLIAHDRLARLAGSKKDLDLARWLSQAVFFAPTSLDEELVVDGSPAADYSLRISNYPYAMLRPGPKRPYIAGMVTIEPVLRNH